MRYAWAHACGQICEPDLEVNGHDAADKCLVSERHIRVVRGGGCSGLANLPQRKAHTPQFPIYIYMRECRVDQSGSLHMYLVSMCERVHRLAAARVPFRSRRSVVPSYLAKWYQVSVFVSSESAACMHMHACMHLEQDGDGAARCTQPPFTTRRCEDAHFHQFLHARFNTNNNNNVIFRSTTTFTITVCNTCLAGGWHQASVLGLGWGLTYMLRIRQRREASWRVVQLGPAIEHTVQAVFAYVCVRLQRGTRGQRLVHSLCYAASRWKAANEASHRYRALHTIENKMHSAL